MKTRRSAKEQSNDTTSQSESNSKNDDSRPSNPTPKKMDIPSLFPTSEPEDEQKAHKAKQSTPPKTTTKKKFFPTMLRSEPAPYTRSTSKKSPSTQNKDLNHETTPPAPIPDQNRATTRSEAQKSVHVKKANHPLPSRVVAKSQSEVVKPSRQPQTKKSSTRTSTPTASKSQPSLTSKVPSCRRTSTEKKATPSRSIFDLRLEERPGRKIRRMPENESKETLARETMKRMKANAKKKSANLLAPNNLDLARASRLPLPLEDPLPPVPRKGTKRTPTAPSRNVREPQSFKGTARNTVARKTSSENQTTPMTRARKMLEQQTPDGSGKSRHPPSSKMPGKRASKSSVGSERGRLAEQSTTNTRAPITFSGDEYDSESPPKALQDTKVRSSYLEAASPEHESSSTSKSDDSGSESGSYEYSSDSDSESRSSPPRRGKTIPEPMRRVMVSHANLENPRNEEKHMRKGTSRKSIDKPAVPEPVAGKSIAKKTVAGKTVIGKTGGKTLAGKTVAGKTLAGKALAGKTIAGKTLAGKGLAGKTIAAKTLPQRNIPRRMVRAGGIQHDSNPVDGADYQRQKKVDTPLRSAKTQADSDGNHTEGEQDDAADAGSSEKSFESYETSDDDDSDNDSGTDDSSSDDDNNTEDVRRSQTVARHGNKSTKPDYESRRKEMRERCSTQLQNQNKERYSASVREEFFLEMEYHMYLKRQVTDEDGARDELNNSLTLFENNIAPLRIEGLESMGCQLEAQNYRSWLTIFKIGGRVLKNTSDPKWKEKFLSILSCLKSARSSTNTGKTAKLRSVEITETQLHFMTENWQLLAKAADLLNIFSTEMLNIQTAGGGCQLQ